MASEDSIGQARRWFLHPTKPMARLRPFLLIVRTGRIVTARFSRAGSAGYTGFPAYSQLQRTGSLPHRAALGSLLPRFSTLGPL